MKSEKEILTVALKAIVVYVERYRPAKIKQLRAQLDVIKEIALSALDEARDVVGATT